MLFSCFFNKRDNHSFIITLFYIWFTNKKLIFWNIDPKDYQQKSSTVIAEKVVNNLFPGSVILMHDGRINTCCSNTEFTIDALKLILKLSKNSTEKFSTIGEIIL